MGLFSTDKEALFQKAQKAKEQKSYAKALRLYIKAAEQGHGEAAMQASTFYAKGLSVPKDEKERFRWLLKGAELGDATEMAQTASRFYFGTGTEKNCQKALAWARKARDSGELSKDVAEAMDSLIALIGNQR